MNSPPTTPSSRRLMTSKIRFLSDGAGDEYLQGYFSQRSSTSSALLGLSWTVETLPWSSKLSIRAQTSPLERPLG